MNENLEQKSGAEGSANQEMIRVFEAAIKKMHSLADEIRALPKEYDESKKKELMFEFEAANQAVLEAMKSI